MSRPGCRCLASEPEGERRETGEAVFLAQYRRRKVEHRPDGLLLDVRSEHAAGVSSGCCSSSSAGVSWALRGHDSVVEGAMV